MEDAEAVQRLKQGDIRGLEWLVSQYYVKAVRAAILVTRDRALAEDVVQSSFLRVYDRIGQFDASRAFAPWFLRLVVNAAVDAVKRYRCELPLDALETTADDGSVSELDLTDYKLGPEDAASEAEMQETVRAALARLAPEQRAVVVLRYYLGYRSWDLCSSWAVRPMR